LILGFVLQLSYILVLFSIVARRLFRISETFDDRNQNKSWENHTTCQASVHARQLKFLIDTNRILTRVWIVIPTRLHTHIFSRLQQQLVEPQAFGRSYAADEAEPAFRKSTC
jgi:exopolysaccharide biosynthesis predicted pyruvyltransferase EpsI